jgi:hypothetical protein
MSMQAGFAPPAVELDYKVSGATAGAESLKDILNRIKPYTTPGGARSGQLLQTASARQHDSEQQRHEKAEAS